MRAWILRVGMMVLVGALLGAPSGCGHNPNHGINMEQAREAAERVHPRRQEGVKTMPGHGG